MKQIIAIDEFGMTERKGQAVTSSLKVAEYFGKRHDHVLRDIAALDCSECFSLPNFGESTYKDDRGKKQRMVFMTKDGFMFLVMGYRGKKAASIKEAYINRFNQMEKFITDLATAKMDFPQFTDAVMQAHEEPKHFHFSNECDLINRIVTGKSAKQIRELHGIESGTSIRPALSLDEIDAVVALQKADIGLLLAGVEYALRKEILTAQYMRMRIKALSA